MKIILLKNIWIGAKNWQTSRSQIIFNSERIQWVVKRMVFCMRMSGVLWAVNCNWNGDGWNVNANPIDDPNRWNDGNQVFSRNSDISPAYLAGVFFSKRPFLQAPKFLPISSSFSESSIYFSLGINLFSQASWTRNLRISKREIIFPNKIIFGSIGK